MDDESEFLDINEVEEEDEENEEIKDLDIEDSIYEDEEIL